MGGCRLASTREASSAGSTEFAQHFARPEDLASTGLAASALARGDQELVKGGLQMVEHFMPVVAYHIGEHKPVSKGPPPFVLLLDTLHPQKSATTS